MAFTRTLLVCVVQFLMFLQALGDEVNPNEFLKREHSLMRPYTGKYVLFLLYFCVFWGVF